jgi:hypothetical protein
MGSGIAGRGRSGRILRVRIQSSQLHTPKDFIGKQTYRKRKIHGKTQKIYTQKNQEKSSRFT